MDSSNTTKLSKVQCTCASAVCVCNSSTENPVDFFSSELNELFNERHLSLILFRLYSPLSDAPCLSYLLNNLNCAETYSASSMVDELSTSVIIADTDHLDKSSAMRTLFNKEEIVCSICLEQFDLLQFNNIIPMEPIADSADMFNDYSDSFFNKLSFSFGNIRTHKTFLLSYVLNFTLLNNLSVFAEFIQEIGLPFPNEWMHKAHVDLEIDAYQNPRTIINDFVLRRSAVFDRIREYLEHKSRNEACNFVDAPDNSYFISHGYVLKDKDVQCLLRNEQVFNLSPTQMTCYNSDTKLFFDREGSFFDVVNSMSVNEINAWFADNGYLELFND